MNWGIYRLDKREFKPKEKYYLDIKAKYMQGQQFGRKISEYK
ncbi:hypothetical protein CLOHYLEM_07553 [[Clostridium] hylemonae DSM 15053]|uniref:Uncharacterized protein n=1 Tax=[Clostridium] hylemonae DSM 15053 TaxID=553973 RepID=C0C616_9FIRM|nr:hypothetical protein CLOHYLEM_07553 [[Clostridium] hylemonae DSM 15053]